MRQAFKQTLRVLRQESMRRLVASEKAVEKRFQEARLRASLAIGLVVVGFFLVATWKGNAYYSSTFKTQSERDLAQIIQEMTAENNAMRYEILHLETQVYESGLDEKGRKALLAQAEKEIDDLRVMSGSAEAVGPGVIINISDPDSVLLPRDLSNVVNELRAAGAEAMSLDGKRVTATTGFSQRGGRLYLDQVAVSRDMQIVAIGDGNALRSAVEMPGGLKASLEALSRVGLSVRVVATVRVPPALTKPFVKGKPLRG